MDLSIRYVDDTRLPAEWAVACDAHGVLIFMRVSASCPENVREAREAAVRLAQRRLRVSA